MDEQVFVRLENGEIIPLQSSDIQGSSFIIQQPVDPSPDQDVAEPVVMEDVDYESNNAEKVVYIVNQEGTSLEGMQFTVFGDDGADGQTLTLQTIVSGDDSVNYADVSNSLNAPDIAQSSIPIDQHTSAIEALSGMAVSDQNGSQTIVADDTNQTYDTTGATDTGATSEIPAEINQDGVEDVNFTFYCQECNAATDDLVSFKQHLLDEHGILELEKGNESNNDVTLVPSCTVCSKTFVDHNELNEHMECTPCGNNDFIVAGADDRSSQVMQQPVFVLRCRHCTGAFSSRDELADHMASSHPGKSLKDSSNTNMFTKCPYCHKMYVHRGVNKALINHILTAHPGKYPLEDAKTEEKITCKYCSVDFYWKKSMIRHIKQCHPDEFNAEGDNIITELGLQEVHYPKRRVRRSAKAVDEKEDIVIMKCQSCPKCFLWEKSLKRHMMDVHNEEYQESVQSKNNCPVVYKCPYCRQVSKYACAVRKHVSRKHKSLVKNIDVNKMVVPKIQAAGVEVKSVDKRPVEIRLNLCRIIYRCPFCSYASKQASNLNRHLTSKIHGHIFTHEELKYIGLSSFRVQNKKTTLDNEQEKNDGTLVSSLPKLKMKKEVLDFVMEKYEILKQRNLADKENTNNSEDAVEYNDLDIENVIALAEEESEESFDEDDFENELKDTDIEVDDFANEDNTDEVKGQTSVKDDSAKALTEAVEDVDEESNTGAKGKHAHIANKANKTLETKNQTSLVDSPMLSISCIVCKVVFDKFTQFQKHLHSHVNLKVTFDCMDCQEKFSLSKDILKHLSVKHDIRTTELEAKYIMMSKMTFNRKPLLTYDCPYCDMLFSQSGPLYQHVIEDHLECIDAAGIKSERDSIMQGNKRVIVTAYRCQFCECSFHNITDIVKHMGIIHAEVEKMNKKSSVVRKSGRKRKVPKWLEDEIELTTTSKRLREDEELDADADDWTMKPPNVSQRKKPAAKSNRTNISKGTNTGAKRNILQTTGEDSETVRDKNDIPDNVSAVSKETVEPKEANSDSSLPLKPKTAKRKSKGDVTNHIEVLNNAVTINKCPHCNFTAKRASALTFHINFNHAGIEIKKEPVDPDDNNYRYEPKDNKINKAESLVSPISRTGLKTSNGIGITKSPDDDANEDDLFDEDIDFGDSDDDFIPFVDDKDGHEGFGFSASVKLGCPYCINGFFSTFSQVKEHVHEQHPEKSDEFSITDVKTKVELDDDDKLSNLLNTCHYCKKKFRGNSEIRAHIKEEHGSGVEIKFTKLDKKQKPDANFEAAIEIEDMYSYRCSYCSTQYDIAENAVRHVHELHSDKKQVTILVESSKEVTEGFKCPYCVMKSKYKRCIVRHVSRAHKDIKNFHKRDIIVIGRDGAENTTYYQCSFCGFESKYKNTVSQHMNEMHPDECATVKSSMTLCNTLDYLIDHDDGEDYFKCIFCDTVFETKSEVAAHVAADHQRSDFDENLIEKLTENYLTDRSVYKCPVCGQGSKWLVATVRHMKISHPELKEYKVEKCILENEEDGNTVFRCEVCNGFFNTHRGIVQHFMSVHGKEEKYEIVNLDTTKNSVTEQFCCPYCDYRAKEKKAIIEHVALSHPDLKKIKTKDVIHVVEDGENLTDAGGYQCPYCNVVNHWRKSIIRHIRNVHYGKPYNVHIEYVANAALPAYGSTARKSSKLIECLKCGTIRRSVKTMKQHFQEKHRKYTKHFLNMEYTKFKYATTKRANGNPDSEALTPLTNGGRVLHHGCVLCGAKYVWKKSLLVHIKNHHKDMYEVYQTMDQVIDIVCNAAGTHFQCPHSNYRAKYCVKKITGDFIPPSYVQADVAQSSETENTPLKLNKQSSRKVRKQCKKCRKTFTTNLAARIHKKLHHKTNRFFRFSCNICSLSFSTGSKLKIHKIIQHKYKKAGSWQCTTCNFRCKYWSLLQNHFMREHAPRHKFPIDQGVYKCEICSKLFSSSHFLKQHLAMHKKTRTPTFQCPACRQHFSSMVSRDTHIEHEHADMTEMCDVCGEMFTKRNLKMHVRSHSEPHLVINCTFCKKSVFEKTFNRHVLNYHSDLETCTCSICSSDILSTPEGSSKCRICLKNTCHKVTLYVHMKFNHADIASSKVFQCEMCPDKYFSSKQLRDAHCHKHHKRDVKSTLVSHLSARNPNLGNDDPTTHVIHIGQDEGKQFLPKLSETSMNAVLKELIVFERGSKNPHKCLLCGRSFSKLKYIKLHVRRAHVRDEDQPYRCKVCGSGFVRLTEFRKHTRSHSDFRPYKCNYCDKAFKQQANLTDHYRVHTNTKSYQCFICKTTFRQRGGLTSHVVFHDTLKPYKCMYCNKGYTTRGELSRHMQKYNRDGDGLTKSYQCHLCEDSFPHYPMLMKHIELHSPEKPFQCHMCNTTFSSFVTMYFHKVDQGHFFQEDLEQGMKDLQERGRKFRAKKMESQLLMTEYGGNEAENALTGEIMYVNQADRSLQNEASVKPVEIIVEEFGKEHVVHVQESEPEHEELLSIAKQLTELSGFTETEVHTSVKKSIYQEEDEIIKHMLDADEDVLASLNKSKMYNNGITEINNEQVEHFNERIDDSYTEMTSEDINVKGVSQDEPNSSYDNQTLPTTMEELVSIVSQNVTTDGNEQVMAYQSEDGSLIYVCLPEGDDKTKEIILEQGAEEEQYVTNEVTDVIQDESEDIGTKDVTQIVANDFNNEVGCDIEARNESDVEETFVEQTMLTSEIQGQETNQIHTINSSGVEYVQISVEGLQQVATGEINPNELNMLQRELSTDQNVAYMSTSEPSGVPNNIKTYSSDEVVVSQDENLENGGSIEKPVIAEELVAKYDENADEGQMHNYSVIEQADAEYEEMVEPAIDAEESREALLQRSQLAQHLTGNIPPSSASSSGSTHMIFTGEGLQTITSSVSDAYANSESLQTDNVSQSLINIAAASAKIDDNAKQDIVNISVTNTENVINTENTETVVEYHIDEARFIKEELLDTSFSAASGSGESAKAAAAEVMFVSDNIYTYSQAEKKFICLHCGQKIGSFKNLKNHIRRHAPESARIHKCSYCDKRFVTKNEWKRHTWTHTGERNYECKYCGKKFIQPGHLAEHVRLHTGKKPFNCNVCKHAFNTHSQLKLHWSRMHSNNKIPCPQCDKVFKNTVDLKRHKGLEHMGVKTKRAPKPPATTGDNICDICGMSFLKKGGLKLHLERHNLENTSTEEQERFSCEICGSSFKSKYYASEHMKSVHGDKKNEVCETCGMAFRTKPMLRRHRDMKHSEFGSKWQCKTCNKPFGSSSALAYHVGSKH